MSTKCLVVDDEHLARTLIGDYISKLPQLELVAKCSGAPDAMKVLQEEQVDLMFLDIQMPELTGIDFLKAMDKKPLVVFTTAYPDYALEGYSLDVIDYLLKPISFERFIQSVNKANKFLELKRGGQKSEGNDFQIINADHRTHKIKHSNILYIEGLKEYVIFRLKEGNKIVSLEALKDLEESLPEYFMRVHRSFIINTREVNSLYKNQVEIGKVKIPVGKTYKDKVIKELFEKGT